MKSTSQPVHVPSEDISSISLKGKLSIFGGEGRGLFLFKIYYIHCSYQCQKLKCVNVLLDV